MNSATAQPSTLTAVPAPTKGSHYPSKEPFHLPLKELNVRFINDIGG
jgi:hypothetical protein